jgi:alkylation response protein AidB-like acyl-CoA dehydrogenase
MENLGTIGYSEEQIELMQVATNFCRDKSPMDKVRSLLDDETGFDPAIWQEIADLGWLAIAVPEEYDGVGLSLGEVVPIAEQMGKHMLAGPYIDTILAAQALLIAGSEDQKKTILPQIAGGAVATLALNEAHGDWDFGNVTCHAKQDGDAIALSGEKLMVGYAHKAQYLLASVMFEGQVHMALIESAAISESALRREQIIDETRRTYALRLDNIRIDASQLLDADKSKAALDHVHLAANLLQSAQMAGGTAAVIDYTLDYLKTRKQFGKIIGEYQALKHPITNAYVDYEKARSHVYSAAHCFNDQGRGEVATRMAKAAMDKAYSFAADRAIQFHGGFGFTHDCDAQLYRRAAIWHASQYGDAAYHRAKLADLLF